MGESIPERYIDIRSHGKGVIGRVHEFSDSGEETVTKIEAPTRAHLLTKVRKAYRVSTKVTFDRRGKTNF